MSFSDQEKQIIAAGKASGKTQAQVEQALINYRTGNRPVQASPAENSTIKDLAIGAGKGLGETIAAPLNKISDTSNAMPAPDEVKLTRDSSMSDTTPQRMEITKPKVDLAGDAGLSPDVLQPDNTAQVVGKSGEQAAEFLAPFVASHLGGLVTKVPGLLAKVSDGAAAISDAAKTKVGGALDKVAEIVKNPKLAIGKTTVDPQLEASANRAITKGADAEAAASQAPTNDFRYLAGTQRLADPVALHSEYVAQAKNAMSDIKADDPTGTVGEHVGNAFEKAVAQRRAVGQTMGDELKKIGGVKTDISEAQNNFKTLLKDSDLTLNAKGKITAGANSKMIDSDLSDLQTYAKQLKKLGDNPTIAQIDAMISRTTDLVRQAKASKNIVDTTNAERLIKNSQNSLRAQFDPAKTGNTDLQAYSDARKQYASLSNFIEEGAGYLGKITQSGDFSKDASLIKSAVQSILNGGKKDWLIKLEDLTGYPALDDAVLALQSMKDAGSSKGLSLLQTLSEGKAPISHNSITQKAIDYAMKQAQTIVGGTPEEQTRAFLTALKEAAKQSQGK